VTFAHVCTSWWGGGVRVFEEAVADGYWFVKCAMIRTVTEVTIFGHDRRSPGLSSRASER